MKTILLIPVIVGSLSLVPLLAQGEVLSVPHITVNGTAIKEVVPDRLNWSLEVKNTGLELPKVAEQHAKKVTALLDLLKANGVPDKDVQTAQMEFSENRVYRRNEYVKEGYQAMTNVGFKLNDISKYKSLWTSLAELSGVSVKGVGFDHSKRVELNKETRKLALKMAKEKAVAMAEELGSNIGEPLAIDEDLSVSEGWWRYGGNLVSNSMNNVAQATIVPAQGESGEAIAPGSIPITIRVRVTFRLLNPGS